MYAIIEDGNKQYKVEEGMVIEIDRLGKEPGTMLELDKVLMLVDGEKISVGAPYLKDTKVSAEVIGESKGKKVIAFKMKKRKDYRKKIGHRQKYEKILIKKIIGG
jgi:large subunit ribosomal protein L21